jgi:hypothetical protein
MIWGKEGFAEEGFAGEGFKRKRDMRESFMLKNKDSDFLLEIWTTW